MKRAFTLVEALVTIAIVAIIAALLLPVVARVKSKSDNTTPAMKLESTPPRITILKGGTFRDSNWHDYDAFIIRDRESGVEYIVLTGQFTVIQRTNQFIRLEQ